MEQLLYLLNVRAFSINFSTSVFQIPSKSDIVISVAFGNVANFGIKTRKIGCRESGNYPFPTTQTVHLDCGANYYFSSTGDDLLQALIMYPLELSIAIQSDYLDPIGYVKIPWSLNFLDMVANTRFSPNNLQNSHAIQNMYEIICNDVASKEVGGIDLLVQLSCLGQNADTI